MITEHDLLSWVREGIKTGAAYIISVCDTFDYSDYPVYIMPGEDIEKKKREYDGVNMQEINEVIDLDVFKKKV